MDKHPLQISVELLTKELNDHCGEYGFTYRVKSQLPDLKLAVRTLIGDALIASSKKSGYGFASIHLRSNWYSNNTRYKTKHSYDIFVKRAYRGLIHLGYLSQVKDGVSEGSHGLYLTRYKVTEKLRRLFDPKSIEVLPVLFAGELEIDEIIRVQVTYEKKVETNKVDKYGRHKTRTVKAKELVEFEDSEQTRQMRENLALINKRIASKWVDLELSREEYLELVNQMAKRQKDDLEIDPDDYRPLMLSKRSLYRVFNNIDFTSGGRFYGGWWQEIPSKFRDRITIDGKRTVQLDYTGLHPHILYHEIGLQLETDPYEVDLVPSKNADDAAGFRAFIKKSFNAMLNAQNEMGRPPQASKGKPKETLSYWGVRWKQVVKAIMDKHPAIKDQFFTGSGLRLQRIDSGLAEAVMLALIKQSPDTVVLPVHDSFIVHRGYEDQLRAMMIGAYCLRYDSIPLPKISNEMIVEVAGVPDSSSWRAQPADPNDLADLLDIDEAVPSQLRLSLFREMNCV